MQSTGEVIGIHEDARVAMAKALLAAGMLPPAGGVVLLSVADRDKAALPALAAALGAAAYRFAATSGTAEALRRLGHQVVEVERLGNEAGSGASMLDLLASPELALVINTPSPSSGAVRDAAAIRHVAIAQGTPMPDQHRHGTRCGPRDAGGRARPRLRRPAAEGQCRGTTSGKDAHALRVHPAHGAISGDDLSVQLIGCCQ